MKLWQKNTPANDKITDFTVGKDRYFDLHLAAYDCQASIAHAEMLGKIGVLTKQEAHRLRRCLPKILHHQKACQSGEDRQVCRH